MFNFLHTYQPDRILITLGPLDIRWYGLFIIAGILAAIFTVLKLAGFYRVSKSFIVDSAFYLILGGVIGARAYHVLLELPYYSAYPAEIVKIWHGGLAIHGAIVAGVIVAFFLAKKNNTDHWLLLSVYAAGMPLAQAIGRWGNYFNQELFGRPTDLPWGIPIAPENRPAAYFNHQFFHPAFLYEFFGNLMIFAALIYLHKRTITKKYFTGRRYRFILASYLVMYSALRFFTEFIRVDEGRVIFGLRLPQVVSAAIILVVMAWYARPLIGRAAHKDPLK